MPARLAYAVSGSYAVQRLMAVETGPIASTKSRNARTFAENFLAMLKLDCFRLWMRVYGVYDLD